MSAPVLTISEQKAAISGKKKKKKTIKNVLSIPSNQKVESFFVEEYETKKLRKILERLLPSARLPVQEKTKSNENTNEQLIDESNLIGEAMNRRNQLALGVNSVNRSIKKGLISSVLFACDIQPNFLIHHLNLLCNQYKIPFLHIPGLREVTRNNLGFPCIAVGFKKDFQDFSEVIEEIQSILQSKKFISNEVNLENPTESSDSNEEDVDNTDESLGKSDEYSFTYLFRTSIKERVFIPENIYMNQPSKESKTDFLKIENDDTESKSKNLPSQLGISSKFNKQMEQLNTVEELYDDDDDDELEAPKKKIKKDTNKVGKRGKIKYYPANLMKVPSNPHRIKKNK